MRDRGGRARIASKAAAAISDQESHRSCGKFCVEVISGVPKPLEFRTLLSFEPKRSTLAKLQRRNALARPPKNGKNDFYKSEIPVKLTVISTDWGGC